ncbi:hypothetical protein ACFLUN_00775 [Chloroflexota bacterium]
MKETQASNAVNSTLEPFVFPSKGLQQEGEEHRRQVDYYAGLHLPRIHQFVNSHHHPVIVSVMAGLA